MLKKVISNALIDIYRIFTYLNALVCIMETTL